MASLTRLAGFKIMKEVVCSSLFESPGQGGKETGPCHIMAENKINLPYLTSSMLKTGCVLNLVIDAHHAGKLSSIIESRYSNRLAPEVNAAILSIFPHRNNFEVIGRLLDAFADEGVEPIGLASSPSAISVVLSEKLVKITATALFGSFSFSAYRTPSDWKLAQKGKEELYKEVVASYQEKKPKVYGLEWENKEILAKIDLAKESLVNLAPAFKGYATQGLRFTFLISGPSPEEGRITVFFCLPDSTKDDLNKNLHTLVPQATVDMDYPVAHFSMNGPHFGDRYAIASELLKALDRSDVKLLGLSCSIASITGVVTADKIQAAINAIEGCFDVPKVTKKA